VAGEVGFVDFGGAVVDFEGVVMVVVIIAGAAIESLDY
jgi:hypothetical protein